MNIVLTGPESTGKTTLATQLAAHYGVDWVPEYARQFLDTLNRDYHETDLLQMATEQLRRIREKETNKKSYLFCDTGLLVLKIWSVHKYGRCHPWILEQLHTQRVDLYLLCGVDTPWVADPQREHPHLRHELYTTYKKELWQMRTPFVELQGTQQQRFQHIVDLLDAIGRSPYHPAAK